MENEIRKEEEQKQEILKNAQQLFEIRNSIIDAFQNDVFPSPKKVQEKHTKEEGNQTEEKAIPDWVKISNYAFKRMQEYVNEYIKKGWFSKGEGKKIKMNYAKIFLEDIVDKKFNNAEEARIWYANNIFDQEKEIKGIDNKTNSNIDMLNLYDSLEKNLLLQIMIKQMMNNQMLQTFLS